jgi:hypothetical protein
VPDKKLALSHPVSSSSMSNSFAWTRNHQINTQGLDGAHGTARQRSGAREQQIIIILTSSLSAAPPCGDILARMLGSGVRSSLLEDYSLCVLSRHTPSCSSYSSKVRKLKIPPLD